MELQGITVMVGGRKTMRYFNTEGICTPDEHYMLESVQTRRKKKAVQKHKVIEMSTILEVW